MNGIRKRASQAYLKKLRDPRWQRMRLEILNRDDFTCMICGDSKSTLHVHHRRYISGREPWEYPEQTLATLCETCHQTETVFMPQAMGAAVEMAKDYFFSNEVYTIAAALAASQNTERPRFASVIAHAIADLGGYEAAEKSYLEMRKKLGGGDGK